MNKKYAPVLKVIVGKRYMLTRNKNLPCGVANGMWAVVRDVQLRPGVVPRWDAAVGAHRVNADDVKCLVIRYTDREWGKRDLHADLPKGHFLVVLDTPQTPGCNRFTFMLGGNEKKFRVSQVPLVAAHAISGHRSQSQTPPHIRVSHLQRVGRTGEVYWVRALGRGWFYTAVSRTKTREGLVLRMKELPLELTQERRLDVLAEMARLRVLQEETRIRAHSTPATVESDASRLTAARILHPHGV